MKVIATVRFVLEGEQGHIETALDGLTHDIKAIVERFYHDVHIESRPDSSYTETV